MAGVLLQLSAPPVWPLTQPAPHFPSAAAAAAIAIVASGHSYNKLQVLIILGKIVTSESKFLWLLKLERG